MEIVRNSTDDNGDDKIHECYYRVANKAEAIVTLKVMNEEKTKFTTKMWTRVATRGAKRAALGVETEVSNRKTVSERLRVKTIETLIVRWRLK